MSAVFMRVLESTPDRYDAVMRALTLGRVERSYDRLAARLEPGWRLLDVGAGTGGLALRAAARGCQVLAIDVNAGMLAIARGKGDAAGLAGRVEWREMGVAEVDSLPAAGFDAVSAGLCLSELSADERRYFLGQALRLLRPGGLLLLADEVAAPGLAGLLLRAVRVPLTALTWLLAGSTTRAVPDLEGLVRRTGLEIPVWAAGWVAGAGGQAA
jgi:ubiquinone/menaquinone biosynthesis C-methylase UbiE